MPCSTQLPFHDCDVMVERSTAFTALVPCFPYIRRSATTDGGRLMVSCSTWHWDTGSGSFRSCGLGSTGLESEEFGGRVNALGSFSCSLNHSQNCICFIQLGIWTTRVQGDSFWSSFSMVWNYSWFCDCCILLWAAFEKLKTTQDQRLGSTNGYNQCRYRHCSVIDQCLFVE